ncbi:MAG: radical SAM protein [Candidatus Omnitrophica bacterium]|nr:radical SAM protein [Candidatus Omnitrophota bacterium]
MKIVIANSIGIDKNRNYIIHSPSRWSEGVRNKYHWFAYYPWELAYLSSLLKERIKADICFLDGCLMRLDKQAYYNLILKEKPEILIMESSTRMIDENTELALDIKKIIGTKLIFVGQHASAFPDEMLEKGIDHLCIGEYEYTVLELIQGKALKDISGLFPNARRPLLDINSLPWPEDTDVSRFAYAMPGEPSSEYHEIQMYTSRGCPGGCNFCVARHIYYAQPNWRARNIKNVINEIIYLKDKYPRMQGVFFDEEAHNVKKEFIMELTQAIIDSGLDKLKFEAMCDLRFLSEEMLEAMKKAGYYKIRVGIETASEKVMDAVGKRIDIELMKKKLRFAKKIGIKTYGTFTFGAAGSDEKEDQKTIDLMRNLLKENILDNLQLSICTPQPGTPFYNYVKENNFLRNGLCYKDFDGGNIAAVSYHDYDYKKIESMKQKALVIRDHIFLESKIKNQNFMRWCVSVFRKHGILGFIAKAFNRFIGELKFQFKR